VIEASPLSGVFGDLIAFMYLKEKQMQTTRRAFLKWTAIWGLVPFVGTGLFAESAWLEAETIGSIHMDADFDPDGWL